MIRRRRIFLQLQGARKQLSGREGDDFSTQIKSAYGEKAAHLSRPLSLSDGGAG